MPDQPRDLVQDAHDRHQAEVRMDLSEQGGPPIHPNCHEVGSHVSHVLHPGKTIGDVCGGRQVPDPPVTLEDRLRRKYDRTKVRAEQVRAGVARNPKGDLMHAATKLAEFEAVLDLIEGVLFDHEEAQK